MPRGNFHACINPIRDIQEAVTNYIGQSGPIEVAFCEVNSKGLLIATDHSSGDAEKFLVFPLDGRPSAEDPLESQTVFLSLEELLAADFGQRVPIVEGLIHEGETIIIGGRPKVGKSRLVHQLALALINGEPFLGMPVPKKRRVVLFDLENGKHGIQERIQKMTNGASQGGLSVAVSDTLADPKLTNTKEGLEFLKLALDRTGADVLIIDPWRLWLGGDENNGEQVVNGLKTLSTLRAIHPSLTIIILHHVRKENTESPKKLLQDPRLWSDNLSGHHALISHASAAFGIERRTEDETEMIVFGGIARNIEPKTLILEEDEKTLRFDVCRNELAATQVMTKVERGLWNKAKTMPKFRFSEVERESGTKNKKALVSMLKKAQEHGVLIKVGENYLVQVEE